VRLKLDENLDPRAVGVLQSAGHDVATVPDERLQGSRTLPLKRLAEKSFGAW